MSVLTIRSNDSKAVSDRLTQAGLTNFSAQSGDGLVTIRIGDELHETAVAILNGRRPEPTKAEAKTTSQGKILHPGAASKGQQNTIYVDTNVRTTDGKEITLRAGDAITFIEREGGPRPGSWTVSYNNQQLKVGYDELKKLIIE